MRGEREREQQHVCIPDMACSPSSCPLSIEFLPIISPRITNTLHDVYFSMSGQHFSCLTLFWLYTCTRKAPAMDLLPLAGKWYKFDQIIACYCYSLVHYWFTADEHYWKLICPSPCLQVAGILIADTAMLQLCVYISVMYITDNLWWWHTILCLH